MFTGNGPFTGFIDSAVLFLVDGNHYQLTLTGWILFSKTQIKKLTFLDLEGKSVEARLVERSDVAQKVSTISHALYSGFEATISADKTYQTEKTITFNAELMTGENITSSFTVRATPALEVTPKEVHLDSVKQTFTTYLVAKLEWFFHSHQQILFLVPKKPLVSIIIPVYNQAALLLHCLEGLRGENASGEAEIIVVDNGSNTEVQTLLRHTSGLKIIRNESNLGFSRACNQGAHEARAGLLLFLNSDCFPLPNALAAAREAIGTSSSIGAVGATFIDLKGRLLEAGSFLLPNGTTIARGRGGNTRSKVNHVSLIVDYCSAAFLLTPKEIFILMRGFSEEFTPAYYEDVDYCARLKQRGLLTIVLPQVVAIHMEGSSSMHTSNNKAALFEKHRDIFLRKHTSFPTSRRRPQPGHTIFFIDDAIPCASRGQGQGRSELILNFLLNAGYKVRIFPADGMVQNFPDQRYSLAFKEPQEDLTSFLRREFNQSDIVFVSRPQHMENVQEALRALPAQQPRPYVVYDAESLQSKREILKLELSSNIDLSENEVIEIVSNEIVLAVDADTILAVSEEESCAFKDFEFSNVHVVSYGINTSDSCASFENRAGFLMIGPLLKPDTPNSDALRWFLKEVTPRLKKLMSSQAPFFHVIGESKVTEFENCQDQFFKLIGHVGDLTTVYDTYRVFVAPTRFASGISVKVIEAAAHGIPVVASPLVAMQLGWKDEEELLVAASPEDFARQCYTLHSNPDLWKNIQQKAFLKVRKQFSVDQFNDALTKVFNS